MTTPAGLGGSRHWTRCRIGLSAGFAGDGFDSELLTAIVRRELSQRLPAAEITDLAGAEQADELDCVIVTGHALLPEAALTARGPVMWQGVTLATQPREARAAELVEALADAPYVGVADPASKEWLEAAGVDREIVVLPHPALLASRLFPTGLIEKRLEYLRAMGWYPSDGPALVVHGNGSLAAGVHEVAADLEKLAAELDAAGIVVLRDLCPDDQFADALADALTRLPYRPPALAMHDTAACVAASVTVVTISPALAATALSYGRPHAPTSDPCRSENRVAPEQLLSLQSELDASYDQLASIAVEAAAVPGDSAPDVEELLATLSRLRRAHEIQSRRLAEERLVLADQVIDLGMLHKAALTGKDHVISSQQRAIEQQTAELERSRAMFDHVSASADTLRAGLAAAEAQVATVEAELAALRATRTFRWAAPARSLVARLQRLAR